MPDEAPPSQNNAAVEIAAVKGEAGLQRARPWLEPVLIFCVAAIALSTLIGWTRGVIPLTHWAPGFATQKPVTALAFLALALALTPVGTGEASWRSWLGWAVIAVAAASLAENFTRINLGINLGIGAWLASHLDAPGPGRADWRMATATAVTLLCAGAAVSRLGRNRHVWVVPLLAIIVGLSGAIELALVPLAGRELDDVPALGAVSLPTAVASLLFGIVLMLQRPLNLGELVRQSGAKLGICEWLIAFGVMTVLPVLLFAGLAAQRVATAERVATLVNLEHRTEAAASKVERYLQSLRDLAVTLSEASSLHNGDLSTFHGFARRAMEAGKLGRSVALVDPTGQMLINTRQPFGATLPFAAEAQALSEAVTNRAPSVSGLFQGAVSHRHVFIVWVPMVRDGQVNWVVGITVEPQDLTAILREEHLPDGWVGAVIDSHGIIVARSQAAETFVGRLATRGLRASLEKRQWGIFPNITAAGIPVLTSIRKLQNSGWTMAVGVPLQVIDAPANASRRFMLGLLLASLLAAGAMAFVLGRPMSRHIASVAAAAVAVGEGREPQLVASSVREVDAVLNALAAARSLIHQREVALRESEADFRGFFENINVGTAQIDTEGRFRRVNKRYCELTGYSQEELLAGMGPLDLDHPDDREVDRERLERFLQGQTEDYEAEKRYVHKNGHPVWVRVTAKFVANERDGDRRYTAGVIEDITERKRVELTLLEATRLTAIACEAGRMGTWHLDILANKLDYSAEALALIGIERKQWQRTPEALEAFMLADDIERRRQDRAKALAAGERIEHDFRVCLPDGAVRWLHSRGNIFRDADGRATESFGVILDITERKRGEQHQEMLISELDHRVKNVLALVETIVPRSREGVSTMDEYIEAMLGRLEALSQAHSAMSRGGWVGGDLGTLVHQELKPYATAANTTVDGPKTVLTPAATQALVLVLHELATNAAKYGAFAPTAPNGHVAVTWQLDADTRSHLAIDWRESGGPVVSVPERKTPGRGGYGSSVIRELILYELPGSTVAYHLEPAGVRCHIVMPLAVPVVGEA